MCTYIVWTDARRPVPRLWIRSAEERGERRYENWNTTTTTYIVILRILLMKLSLIFMYTEERY